jgi:malate dehydrogenase (oxaloacetate-decarboxylating)(NADP+)
MSRRRNRAGEKNVARETIRIRLKAHGGHVPRGLDLLHDPLFNKGTAFSEAERDALGLRGLLPAHVCAMEEQVERVMEGFYRQPTPLDKYIYLNALHDRNETLFFRVVMDRAEEMMPIIYTPTVGQACQMFGHIFQRPRGIFVSARDRGRVARVLRNWPYREEVAAICVTDGERILGLGDQGADGMGIPVGKLALYTVCAGVRPITTLPVMLDVGTDNQALLQDPLYIGIKQRRIRGPEYDALVEEFVQAVQEVFPHALLQFEDFGNANAFRLLRKYRERLCTFNDDIQGTGAVTLAALISALRITGGQLGAQTVLCLGAGEAAVGICDMIVAAMRGEGAPEAEARGRCWLVDSQGLVVEGRGGLAGHKLPYAHRHAPVADFAAAVRALRPTAIIGVSGQAGGFSRAVVEAMAEINERPVIFALSNPTSKAECTAEEAYGWSGGRAIFASGSPFPPVRLEGRSFVPGQCNNAYIFPGVALGVIASRARQVSDEMFFVAARTLAHRVEPPDLEQGRLFPPLARIREVSAEIAAAVAEVAWERGLARGHRPRDLPAHIREQMYEPVYQSYV